jgi:hypothetical protein
MNQVCCFCWLRDLFSCRITVLALAWALWPCLAPRASAQTGQWVQAGGQDILNQYSLPTWGILGTPAPGNIPGGRDGAVSWTDKEGHLWLYGGEFNNIGYCSGAWADLWEFDPSTLEWGWMGGSSLNVTTICGDYSWPAVYGAIGVTGATNTPGSRNSSIGWTDNDGSFWLYGGEPKDEAGSEGMTYNDLWKLSPTTLQWSWMGGNNGPESLNPTTGPSGNTNPPGVYGTVGKPAGITAQITAFSITKNVATFTAQNSFTPGLVVTIEGLSSPIGQTLDGVNFTVPATGFSSSSFSVVLASSFPDTPTTNDNGLAVPSANIPGARSGQNIWVDKNGNFWMYGGSGLDSHGFIGYLNDLWEYSPSSRQWTWMGGGNTLPDCTDISLGLCYAPAVYGSLGEPSALNTPGGREGAASWTDSDGNFWLYGGIYLVPNGRYISYELLNDLWKFDPVAGDWTWMGGSSSPNQAANYGTKGQPSTSNAPGAMAFAQSWLDSSGNLWLYGGATGYNSTGAGSGFFIYPNNLWEFDPSTQEWTWVDGSGSVNSSGGEVRPGSTPGTRSGSSAWTDGEGHLWLFGGMGYGAYDWNDMWEYQTNSTPTTPELTITPSATSIAADQSLTVQAAVSVTGDLAPTGDINLTSPNGFVPGEQYGTENFLAFGRTTLNIPANSLAPGVDTLTAAYAPASSVYNSATASFTVLVTASSSSNVTLSLNPSKGVTYNQTVAISASVPSTVAGGKWWITQDSLDCAGASGLVCGGPPNTTNGFTVSSTPLTAGQHIFFAYYSATAPSNNILPSNQVAQVIIAVAQATPTITWAAPSAIEQGTPLSTKQLDATASVAGSFSYNPPAGTVLNAGQRTLSVAFTPNDTTDYTTATATVQIVVNQGAPAGLQFVSVTPCRVADTRNPTGPFGGPEMAAGSTRAFEIPQSACNIPTTAVAYSLNVTVVPNGSLGYLALWPAGEAQPLVSTLNSDGRIKANAAIVSAGTNGGVDVYVTDSTQVVLDIDGYFVPAGTTSALAFYPVTPCRVADTRNPTGPLGGPTMSGGTSRAFPVQASACGIPATAQAYSLNVTAVPHGSLGYLTLWPTGEAQPYVSTLNSPTGEVVANAAIVPAGTGGEVSVYVLDSSDVVLDIDGYFAPPGSGGLSLYTVSPCRVIDTRNGAGAFSGVLTVNVEDSTCAPPSTAQGYVLNATVVPSSGLGYLMLWPNGETQPYVSTLNAPDGTITSNMAIVPATNGSINAYSTNSTQLTLDLSSYFAP